MPKKSMPSTRILNSFVSGFFWERWNFLECKFAKCYRVVYFLQSAKQLFSKNNLLLEGSGISDPEDVAIAIRRKLNSSYTHSNLSWLSKAIQLQITATKNR